MIAIRNMATGLAVLSINIGTTVACDNQSNLAKKMPNVLILFSDQHNKKVMGFENHPDVITPNLDKLAKESVVFDRAYYTTGICAPSRSSLMSGLYSRTLGLLSNGEQTEVMNEVVSLATVFQQNNYKTYLIDGIFTSKGNETGMIKFSSIDNDWCSSLFLSQDPVALESVGTDILTNEPNVTNGNPSFTPNLENFLRESALANHSPSGMKYDPENDGKYLNQSLGVHEHWNNPKDKKYSRNLGKKEGLELIKIENK